MTTELTEQQSLHLSRENLLTLVSSFVGSSRRREDEEHFGPFPEPWRVFGPGAPWRTGGSVFGPSPEPWRAVLARHPEILDAIGDGRFGDEVALNPQPLPSRFAFLVAVAQVVIGRAELFQEIADATSREGEQQGIIIVGGYTSRFSEDFCGTGFKVRWSFPGPRTHWFASELNGIDLIVMATQFEQAANVTFSPGLRQNLTAASTKFVEAGLSKM